MPNLKRRDCICGALLTKDGLKPDPEKIRPVQDMTQPSNTKELKTFLGFVQYLAKFLPNMAEVSAPLQKLLEKNTAWNWEKQKEDSFQQLKRMATSAPVLSYNDPKKPVTLLVCKFERTWSRGVPKRKTSCICFQSININTAKVCPD